MTASETSEKLQAGLGASLRASMRPTPYFERRAMADPGRDEIRLPIISTDDHALEGDYTFADRLPSDLAKTPPQVIRDESGADAWLFPDSAPELILSSNSAISWEPEQREPGITRFADMRTGTYDPATRVADMDREAVWASQLFPSVNFGFCGQRLSLRCPPEAGLAYMRAWNDWIFEDYMQAYPGRFIGAQLTWLPDVEVAVAEVRKNAARGFRSVLFSENPEKLGLPSIHSGYWEPFFAACEETSTVICIHVGSSSNIIMPSSDSPVDVVELSVHVNPILAVVDWMFSFIPVRYPNLKIHLSEGGIDWVPLVYSYLTNQEKQHPISDWPDKDQSPSEVFFRNFVFSGLWDTVAWNFFAEKAPGQLTLEVDYPHADSTFPRSQTHFSNCLAQADAQTTEMIFNRNAARVFNHPLPPNEWTPAVRR